MKPIVYVCLERQYNFTRGRELEYEYMTDFLPGRISSSTDATWQGNIEVIKPIKEVMDTLYNVNYKHVYKQGYNIYPKDLEDIHASIEYLMPHGYCLALNQDKDFKFLAISNQERLKVVLVDPYSANDIVMKEGAAITFGPEANHEGHELFLYQAHFNIYNQACEKLTTYYNFR